MARFLARIFLTLAACLTMLLPAMARAQENPGLAAFELVRQVLQHPRCQNCHITIDAPLQYDDGRVHAMNVKRGPKGHGAIAMECATCHGAMNPPASYGANVPPGAPNWHLPPPETKMVFKDVSAAQLCATIKDPRQTGGKNLQKMLEHNRDDALVGWGWNPGVGRNPVPIPRENFVAAFKQWMDAGAPCPAG
jgi:hypothetical protein